MQGAWVQFLGQGTRFHMLQLRPSAAKKKKRNPNIKKKEIRGPRRGGHGMTHGKNTSGTGSREQMDSWEREYEDLGANVITGVRVESTSKRREGIYWCIWVSLGHREGRPRRGTCGRNQTKQTPLVHLVTWSPGEASGKYECSEFCNTFACCYGLSFVSPQIHVLKP